MKITKSRIEARLFLVSIMFPLVLHLGVVAIPSWLIFLTPLLVRSANATVQKLTIKPFRAWDIAIFSLIFFLYIPTIIFPSYDPLAMSKLFVFSLGLLAAIYFRRTWSNAISDIDVRWFSHVFVIVQFPVTLLQSMTGIRYGNLSYHLGGSTEGDVTTALTYIFRPAGTVSSSPNALAAITVALLPFILSERQVIKKYVSVVLALGVLGLTTSRTGILVAIFILVVFFSRNALRLGLVGWRSAKVRHRNVAGVFALATLTISFSFSQQAKYVAEFLIEKISNITTRLELAANLDGSTSARIDMAFATIKMATENVSAFLVGSGFQNSSDVALAVTGRDYKVHNPILQYFYEGGLVAGLAVILVFIYPVLYAAKHSAGEQRFDFFLAALAVFLVSQAGAYEPQAVLLTYAVVWAGALQFRGRREDFSPK